jgi:uncharacterized protein (DUF2141 family)
VIALWVFLGVMAATCLGRPAAAGDLMVRIAGLRNAEGNVRVAVCSQKEFLRERCAVGGTASASAGRVLIEGVPAGQYAVQAYHDENLNGRLDRTTLGRPAEGLAFSRDARMRFGPPRYRDAVVELPSEGGELSLTMRYY